LVALTDPPRLPNALFITFDQTDAFVACGQHAGATAIDVRHEIVDHVQVLIQDDGLPWTFDRVVGDWISEDADGSAIHPIGLGGAFAAHERSQDDVRLLAAFEIGNANAMDGRLLADRMQDPLFVERLAAAKPLQRPACFCVERSPIRAKHDVEFAVAVDVDQSDADVVRFGFALEYRVRLPRRIFVPEHAMLIDDDDIRLAIAIDVADGDGVADRKVPGNFLRFKANKRYGRVIGENGAGEEGNDGEAPQRVRRHGGPD